MDNSSTDQQIDALTQQVEELTITVQRLVTGVAVLRASFDVLVKRMQEVNVFAAEAEWQPTKIAALHPLMKSAGVRDQSHLQKLKFAGLFIQGVEFKKVGNKLYWHIESAAAALDRYRSLSPEERMSRYGRIDVALYGKNVTKTVYDRVRKIKKRGTSQEENNESEVAEVAEEFTNIEPEPEPIETSSRRGPGRPKTIGPKPPPPKPKENPKPNPFTRKPRRCPTMVSSVGEHPKEVGGQQENS